MPNASTTRIGVIPGVEQQRWFMVTCYAGGWVEVSYVLKRIPFLRLDESVPCDLVRGCLDTQEAS